MAKTILSFEEYNSEIKGNQTDADVTEEVITEECDVCDNDPCTCETTGQEDDDEIKDYTKDGESSDGDDGDDDDDVDSDDVDSDSDVPEEVIENCSEQLKKCYETAMAEACTYEGDDYAEHTVETYVKENASLVATHLCEMYERACGEVKEQDLTIEMYEASCNEMKESFNKRIDEMKEAWSAK